jgi:putative aminopeptidase FrvX
MHTTVETTDLRDLEAISKVYAKFCQDLAADFAQQGDAYQPFIPDYSS